MKVLILVLIASISLSAVEIDDKQQHFIGSAVIGATASGLAKHYGSNSWEAFAIGVATSVLVGIAKERIDGGGYGTEDIHDIYADTLGAVAGSALLSWEF